MANSYERYTGNGSTKSFSVPFPYIAQADVKVYLDNVLSTAYVWTNANTIEFNTAPLSGQAILFRRQTPSTPLVDFSAKARWQTTDLNLAIRQSLYLAEESEDWSPSWLTGAGAPASSTGIEGDFFIDTTSGALYRKGPSTWSIMISLIGPQGPQGAQGPVGPQGLSGNGSGNVIGPASSAIGNFATFNNTTGSLLQDSGVSVSSFATATHNHNSVYQPLDADLTAIAALAGTSGLLQKTGANTWALDTSTYSLSGHTHTASAITDLGTAATRNVGTAANNVVALDSTAKLPAVDGSQLTGVGGTPTGSVIAFAGSTAPSGWLLCFGQAVSRTTFAALFAALGTTYGAGDGSTTFNLPDLRGRVVAGEDDMGGTSANRLTNQTGGIDGDILGATGGAETHTLTIAQMPSHSHTLSANASTAGSGFATAMASNTSINLTTSAQGSGAAHNNVQPTIILNYIIKT